MGNQGAAIETLQGKVRRSSLAESEESYNSTPDPYIVPRSTAERIRRSPSQGLGVRTWELSDGAERPSTEFPGGSLSYVFKLEGMRFEYREKIGKARAPHIPNESIDGSNRPMSGPAIS